MTERILSPQLLRLVRAAGPGYSLANPEWIKRFTELIVRENVAAIQEELDTGLYNEQQAAGLKVAKAVVKDRLGVDE